jgi:hypothetical protein
MSARIVPLQSIPPNAVMEQPYKRVLPLHKRLILSMPTRI